MTLGPGEIQIKAIASFLAAGRQISQQGKPVRVLSAEIGGVGE